MSDTRQFDAVLFDAFGTLIDLDDPVPRLRDALAAVDTTYPAGAVANAFRREVTFYRAYQDDGRDEPSLAILRRRCAEVLRDALGSNAPVAEIEHALTSSLHYRLFDDVVPALDALLDVGYRLAVVSNWDAGLPDILTQLGIADRFDAVSVSAIVGARKPDPRIFGDALGHLDVVPDRAVHVGDRTIEDVTGARAAGVSSLRMGRGTVNGDLATLTDLLDLLARSTTTGLAKLGQSR